jgi:hypothetical protein
VWKAATERFGTGRVAACFSVTWLMIAADIVSRRRRNKRAVQEDRRAVKDARCTAFLIGLPERGDQFIAFGEYERPVDDHFNLRIGLLWEPKDADGVEAFLCPLG